MTDPEERKNRTKLIAQQYGGIFPVYEVFYIQAILYSSRAADEAFQRFTLAVQNDRGAGAIVSAVQEALTHTAGLSRFFWPARLRGVAEARAQKLRLAFAMSGSPMEDRTLRNALEHFDERLDEYLLGDLAGYFFPGPMVESHKVADEEVGHVFRLVDPTEGVFVLMGEKFDFQPIRGEVRRILKLARLFDGGGSRLPHTEAT